tara:strand:+ start:664 stop:1575 length:912 start_codon:yes stop_codon:yes gene_type:complete
MIGNIIKSTGSWYLIRNDKGKIFNSRLRGKFKLSNHNLSNPIATGDKVEFDEDKNNLGNYIINKIAPRNNYLIRQSIKKKNNGHMIASNINQAIIISSLKSPFTKSGFIDRFLISCFAYRIPALVIYNKEDILNNKEKTRLNQEIDYYKKIGFNSLSISAKFGKKIKNLKSILKNKTSLFMGNSGVGKSTLINRLSDNANQKTSEISKKSNKGKHRTTFSQVFDVDEKTKIIDTPGIKTFELFDIQKNEIKNYFPEFIKINDKCKFNNCLHINEPNCEIKKEIDKSIWKRRYNNYLSIIQDFK